MSRGLRGLLDAFRRSRSVCAAGVLLACGGDSNAPPPPPPLSTTLAVANLAAAVDAPLSTTPVSVSGGSAPYSYSVNTALPADLRLNPATGEISGTPAGTLAATTFTITVSDAARATSSKSFSISVDGPQGPDLTLDAITAPATGSIGAALAVSARVRNRGARPTEPFRVGFYLSTDTLVTVTNQFLGACAFPSGLAAASAADCNASLTVPASVASGTYFVGAIADDQAQVSETNRANNTRVSRTSTVVSPPPAPDLVVDAVTAPRTTTINSSIPVVATVRNQGTAPAGALHVGFYYSTDTIITTSDVAAGGGCSYAGLPVAAAVDCRTAIRVPSTLDPGTYYVGAIVDDSSQVGGRGARNKARASKTSTVITEPTLNLTIEGMYLTQSAQTFDGSIPLVAERAALLRVFVQANQANAVTPEVRVRFYRNGTLVDTRTIAAPGASVPTTIDEGALASSWNATIPASMITPGLAIMADVDPAGEIGETSETDNTFPLNGAPRVLDIRLAPAFNAMLVPVLQTPNALLGDVTPANKDAYLDFASRVYPLATRDAAVHAPYSYGFAVSSRYDDTWDWLLLEMDAMRLVEGSTRNYHGVIKPAYASGATGRGTLGGYTSVGIDRTTPVPGSNTDYRAMTAAHEWGHNFGRRHVDCGGPESIEPAYPYANGSIGTFGYDLTRNQLLAPSAVRDLMSYCTPVWISDYTFRAVLDFRAVNRPLAVAAAQRALLVWGRIGPNGLVLEPAFEIVAPPSLPTRPGPYRVRATDDAGRVLFDFAFEGTAIADAVNERQFAFVVPIGESWPASLRLITEGRESARHTRTETLSAARLGAAARRVVDRASLTWNAADYPMALVRDAMTHEVLAFARGGRIDVASPGPSLDVIFSDGVRSVRRAVPVAGSPR